MERLFPAITLINQEKGADFILFDWHSLGDNHGIDKPMLIIL